MAKGQKYYFRDGTEQTGSTHKMLVGPLHFQGKINPVF